MNQIKKPLLPVNKSFLDQFIHGHLDNQKLVATSFNMQITVNESAKKSLNLDG